jgi:hypothetical protein
MITRYTLTVSGKPKKIGKKTKKHVEASSMRWTQTWTCIGPLDLDSYGSKTWNWCNPIIQ